MFHFTERTTKLGFRNIDSQRGAENVGGNFSRDEQSQHHLFITRRCLYVLDAALGKPNEGHHNPERVMAKEHSPKRRKIESGHFAVPSRPSTNKKFGAAQTPLHGEGDALAPDIRLQRNRYGSGTTTSTPKRSRYAPTPHQSEFDGPEPMVDEQDSNALDRDWYGGDELGHTLGDESHNPFGSVDNSWADQEREKALAERNNGKRVTARAAQKQRDVDAWETNRMLTSGVAQRRDYDYDPEDDEEATRVHLLVHDIKPPFLDGRKVFTKQLDPVPAVRDPQSDMAVFSRKGSKIIKEKRQQRERQKQAQEATNMAGTTLGNLMGVKEDEGDSAAPGPEEEGGKGGSKFAVHMKKNQGQSAFSKSKTVSTLLCVLFRFRVFYNCV